MPSANPSAELFRHVSAEKAAFYRSVMDSFAAAKRQFRLHMVGMARSIELQQADAAAVLAYRQRLIDYIERFIGDLVARSGAIPTHISGRDAHSVWRMAITPTQSWPVACC